MFPPRQGNDPKRGIMGLFSMRRSHSTLWPSGNLRLVQGGALTHLWPWEVRCRQGALGEPGAGRALLPQCWHRDMSEHGLQQPSMGPQGRRDNRKHENFPCPTKQGWEWGWMLLVASMVRGLAMYFPQDGQGWREKAYLIGKPNWSETQPGKPVKGVPVLHNMQAVGVCRPTKEGPWPHPSLMLSAVAGPAQNPQRPSVHHLCEKECHFHCQCHSWSSLFPQM